MKRIFFFLVIGVLIGIAWNMKSYLLGDKNQLEKSVKGVSISSKYIPDLSKIQQEINGLPFAEVASSSPEIQKLLHDVQGLSKYPVGQAKMICENICKSIQK